MRFPISLPASAAKGTCSKASGALRWASRPDPLTRSDPLGPWDPGTLGSDGSIWSMHWYYMVLRYKEKDGKKWKMCQIVSGNSGWLRTWICSNTAPERVRTARVTWSHGPGSPTCSSCEAHLSTSSMFSCLCCSWLLLATTETSWDVCWCLDDVPNVTWKAVPTEV